ncbi:hypothetical protein PAMA_019844 [Pampus argenteus]
MGNINMTSVTSSVHESNISSNHSLQAPFGILTEGDHGSFWSFVFSEYSNHCKLQTSNKCWFGVKMFLLFSALLANAGLMWMLLSRKQALTASEVLGLNISVMDVLHCLSLFLDIYTFLHETSHTVQSVNEAFFALILFGCPLLLTFMCLERYLAAARPVAYMRLGRREYRVVLCACAWILTTVLALLVCFVGVFTILLYLSITISVLFLVMLLCLLGIMQVLYRSKPGDGSSTNVPLKRRALKNILAVMVPSVVAYSPLVTLVPFMVLVVSKYLEHITPVQCNILKFLLVFPNCGLYIGPMFYLSHLKQAKHMLTLTESLDLKQTFVLEIRNKDGDESRRAEDTLNTQRQ